MLNHPVTGLTNASEWRHAELLAESARERDVALCPSISWWAAWLHRWDTQWLESQITTQWQAAHFRLARVGR